MHPIFDVNVMPELPAQSTYWTPKPSEIDEEGFGYYRDVWDLRGTSVRDAKEWVAAHTEAFAVADALARDGEEFEAIASALEADDLEDPTLPKGVVDALTDFQDLHPCGLGQLELGVGALSYALSAAKMFPAASCRSHFRSSTWSAFPVVHFAATRPKAMHLATLVRQAGCGFVTDATRPDMLVVASPSISEMLALAQTVLLELPAFRAQGKSTP